ncbi:MAG: voltage-gated potassium channel, partial [Paraglaciecola sp.]
MCKNAWQSKLKERNLMLPRIRKILVKYFAEMRWYTILVGMGLYSVICWLMMIVAGEEALTHPTDFIYWLVVTASTVGYGDLSPVTTMGKYFVSLFVIPVGLSFFALIIGRAAS